MARPHKESTEARGRKKMPSDDYVSQFYIDPEKLDTANFHYRWVETQCMNQDTQSVNNAIRGGYEPVKLADLPSFAKDAALMAAIRGREATDPYVRTGDQILMRCPIEIYKGAKKSERKLARQQMTKVDWAGYGAAIKAPTFVTESSLDYTQERSAAVDRAFAADED